MPARGYESYLRVLKVSLTSERSEIMQLKWSPIEKCLSQPVRPFYKGKPDIPVE